MPPSAPHLTPGWPVAAPRRPRDPSTSSNSPPTLTSTESGDGPLQSRIFVPVSSESPGPSGVGVFPFRGVKVSPGSRKKAHSRPRISLWTLGFVNDAELVSRGGLVGGAVRYKLRFGGGRGGGGAFPWTSPLWLLTLPLPPSPPLPLDRGFESTCPLQERRFRLHTEFQGQQRSFAVRGGGGEKNTALSHSCIVWR